MMRVTVRTVHQRVRVCYDMTVLTLEEPLSDPVLVDTVYAVKVSILSIHSVNRGIFLLAMNGN